MNEFAVLCLKSLLKQIIATKDIIRYAEIDLWDFGYGYSFLVNEYHKLVQEYLRVRDVAFNYFDGKDVKLVGDIEVTY
jgi:hypothetical protein